MKWTRTPPKKSEYYWAIFKIQEDLLDGSPELVKVFYNGSKHLTVFRPGYQKTFLLSDFVLWSEDSIPYPEGDWENFKDEEENPLPILPFIPPVKV